MNKSSRIFLAGHRGLVGSATFHALKQAGFENVITRTRAELDLRSTTDVDAFFAEIRPQVVILAAAKVGGIVANSSAPADFIYDNLMIQTNTISSAVRSGVEKYVFLGSSCIYPKHAPQPINESALLTGPLEETNSAYAVAKIAGIEMCRSFRQQYNFDAIALMPTNLYGPHDNFDLESSHVLPALIRKFHEAKFRGDTQVVLWGTGTPRREFLYADDLADAIIFMMQNYSSDQIINIGWGKDISIQKLGELVASTVGYEGSVVFDATKPDGTPRKVLDVSRAESLGWSPSVDLVEGVGRTYQWYLNQCD